MTKVSIRIFHLIRLSFGKQILAVCVVLGESNRQIINNTSSCFGAHIRFCSIFWRVYTQKLCGLINGESFFPNNEQVTHLTVHAPIPGYRCMHCYTGGTVKRGKWVDQIRLDLGIDEWFKWSNRVQKGNKSVRNFYNNNRIFLKKVTRVTVHTPIPG